MLAIAPATESATSRRREAPVPRLPDTAHAIAAVDLPGVVPAPLAGVAEPIVDRLRPQDLLVDATYQRELTPRSLRLVRRIVEGWDWLKFKAPVVALTDRGFEVVDGQHTAIAAACHPGIATIPVLVVDGSDLQRRARAFVSHAVDRLKATPVQVWHAAVAGGDPEAVTVRDVLERAGVTILLRPATEAAYQPRETVAIGAVRRLVDRRGAMRARQVLEIAAAADLAPITADHVRIAEALLLDPDYVGGLDAERITAALRDTTPKQVSEAAELAVAKRLPAWRALAAVLYRAGTAPKRGRHKAAEAAPATSYLPNVGDVPTAALAAGVERWRRGEAWNPAWGPAPGEETCGVPGTLLGQVVMIAGERRWGCVVDRTMALWRRDGTWPAAGWGPPPSDAECAVPERFRPCEAA